MDDWRLHGQEKYLQNATLYRVVFPQFWKDAYTEKNQFYQMIAAYARRSAERMHSAETSLEGENIRHFWHEHCEFCWNKATTDQEATFYCTKDMRYWVCAECFRDFKEAFRWTEKDATELFG